MYFTRPDQVYAGGHESAGVTAPATRWFLAEGATGSFFNMFILIANPSIDAANVRLDYLLSNGQTVTRQSHRRGQQPRDDLNVALDAPELASGEHLDGRHVDQRRADRGRARDVVAGRRRELAGGAQQPGRDRSPARAGRWREGESGGPQGKQTYILIANTSTFAGCGARGAALRGRHDRRADVPAAGEQPHQRQRRRRSSRRPPIAASARSSSRSAGHRRRSSSSARCTQRQRHHLGAGTNALATRLQ